MGESRIQQYIHEFTAGDYKKTDITPLLGVNWLKQLPYTMNKILLDKEPDHKVHETLKSTKQ